MEEISFSKRFDSLGHLNEIRQSLPKTLNIQMTDIKPDNILVHYSCGPSRFIEVELGDCGNACFVNLRDRLQLQ